MQGKSVQFIKNQGKFIKKNIIKIFQILILEFRIKRMEILFFLEVFFHLMNKKKIPPIFQLSTISHLQVNSKL